MRAVSDLISPMLRFLQTQYCSQALEVMDHMMTMSETPMSKQHMRMSFVGSGSRATRKEYDRIQSLYGIPEETGWSIPMPAVHTNNTRANMQAVYLAGIHLRYLRETLLKRLDILQDSLASLDEATPVEAIKGSRLDAGQERDIGCTCHHHAYSCQSGHLVQAQWSRTGLAVLHNLHN